MIRLTLRVCGTGISLLTAKKPQRLYTHLVCSQRCDMTSSQCRAECCHPRGYLAQFLVVFPLNRAFAMTRASTDSTGKSSLSVRLHNSRLAGFERRSLGYSGRPETARPSDD